jgi:hypothetical protein
MPAADNIAAGHVRAGVVKHLVKRGQLAEAAIAPGIN